MKTTDQTPGIAVLLRLTLPKVLRSMRERRSLGLHEFARAVGLNPSHVYLLESGRRDMTRGAIRKIAIGLRLSPVEISEIVMSRRVAPTKAAA